MKAQNVKLMLFEKMAPAMATEGFKLLKSTAWFVGKKGEMTDYYKTDTFASSEGIRVQPVIDVGSETIQRIYHKVSGIKPADQKYHNAVSFAIWRVYSNDDEKKYEYLVRSDADIKPVATKLLEVFRLIALPFYDRCSSIEAIDKLYNTAPNASRTQMYLIEGWARSAYATIAAKLAGNEDYLALVKAYRAFLKAYAEHRVSQYDALVELLEKCAGGGRS